MKRIIDRLRREPVAVRGFAVSALDLLVASGVIDTGVEPRYEVAVLGLLNLLLFKGVRDRVQPVAPVGYQAR